MRSSRLLESFVGNLSTKVRRATLNGRTYLVAPVTMAVEGVLNGSQGPLYYPGDELSRNPIAWNSMPLMLSHPRGPNGNPISARDPEVLNQYNLGMILQAGIARKDGLTKLRANAWFDEELTKKRSPTIYNKLMNNEKIEISTGLFTKNVPEKGVFNGVRYQAVARHYQPDHLAVFEKEIGACSVGAGCGVNNMQANAGGGCGTGAGGFKPGNKCAKGGGNQERKTYLKASSRAGAASAKTISMLEGYTGTPRQKETLAKRHELAAALHKKAAIAGRPVNYSFKTHHTKKAAEHRDIAKTLRKSLTENSAAMKSSTTNQDQGGTKMPKITTKLNDKQRKAIVDNLVSNCNCQGWSEEDRETLNAMNDKKLITMDECRKSMAANQARLAAADELLEDSFTFNAETGTYDPNEEDEDGDEGGEDEGGEESTENEERNTNRSKVKKPKTKTPTNNGGTQVKKLTMNEVLDAVPELKALVGTLKANQEAFDKNTRPALIKRILANESNIFSEDQLKTMDQNTLQGIAMMAANAYEEQDGQEVQLNNYLGLGSPLRQSAPTFNEDDDAELAAPSLDDFRKEIIANSTLDMKKLNRSKSA